MVWQFTSVKAFNLIWNSHLHKLNWTSYKENIFWISLNSVLDFHLLSLERITGEKFSSSLNNIHWFLLAKNFSYIQDYLFKKIPTSENSIDAKYYYGEEQLPTLVKIKMESEKQREMYSNKICKPLFNEWTTCCFLGKVHWYCVRMRCDLESKTQQKAHTYRVITERGLSNQSENWWWTEVFRRRFF